jgi:hypothetical protein
VSLAAKAAIGWLLLLAVMFANGAVRAVVLQPRLGEERARQVASLTGAGLVILGARLLLRASPEASPARLWRVGAGWLAATVAFELVFGRFVSGMSWRALLADYDITRGRLWPLVLVSLAVAPRLWGALRGGARA